MVSILNNKLMEEKMKKGIKIIKRIAVLLLMVAVLSATLLNVNIGKAASGVAINATNFPDDSFRRYVDGVVDTNGNEILDEKEIANKKEIILNGYYVTDLTGIQYFYNLEELNVGQVSKCGFDTVDLSKNLKLKRIYIYNNENLKKLDTSKLVMLEELIVQKCPNLTALDVRNNTKLKSLWMKTSPVKKLDISKNPNLEKLDCGYAGLAELDVSNNPKLTYLDCSGNKLAELDVSNNPEITTLFCVYSQLTELDLSNNPKLVWLACLGNQLTKLDLSSNTNLERLECMDNQLTELDLSNNTKLAHVNIEGNNIKVLNSSNISDAYIYCDDDVTIIENSVKSITLNKTSATLNSGKTLQLTATVAPSSADMKTVLWSSSNSNVAKVDSKGLVTAVGSGTATITATAEDRSGVKATCTITVPSPTTTNPTTPTNPTNPSTPSTPQLTSPSDINVYYRTHIQTYGWEGDAGDVSTWRANGNMSGTSGKSKRLEGINIVVRPKTAGEYVDLGVQYTTHCQSYGWLPWSANGEMNGTEGESKRLEAIKLQLTGADKDKYDIYYRVHAQSYGWLGWAKNGAPAGTAGYAKRLEGIQIVVVKKGEGFNQKMENITSGRTDAFVAKAGNSPIVNHPATSNTNPVVPGADEVNVAYRTHVQSYGWQAWKYNGQMSGTSGKSKRLEGINIELRNQAYSGDIVYTTHVQKYGWQGSETDQSKWFRNGQMAGTSGEAKRLEAICINLTGEMGQKYDIYYRVHAQSYGWLGWAKNGAPAGTAGYGKRLEGIQIVLVPKGGTAPGNHQGITSVRTEAYIKK